MLTLFKALDKQAERQALRRTDWVPPKTEQQAEAGEYKKPVLRWRGLVIRVENPAGSVRRGRGWATQMVYDYGYISGTEAVDGDEVDVYLGPALAFAPMVYVVHQRRKGAADARAWPEYDEDKCMLGFLSEAQARAAYLLHYDDPRFLGPITAMPVEEFVRKVRATRKRPAMIKAAHPLVLLIKSDDDRNIPNRAPKGGATSHLNGEFYEGGQYMASQYDMPKGYKKKIEAVVRKTQDGNIKRLSVKRSLSGEFTVYKEMAGSDGKDAVFSGTEHQARGFIKELIEKKAETYRRRGLEPHPTEVETIQKSDEQPLAKAVVFVKQAPGQS